MALSFLRESDQASGCPLPRLQDQISLVVHQHLDPGHQLPIGRHDDPGGPQSAIDPHPAHPLTQSI